MTHVPEDPMTGERREGVDHVMVEVGAPPEKIVEIARQLEEGDDMPMPDGKAIQVCCDCGFAHMLVYDERKKRLAFHLEPAYTEAMRREKAEMFPVLRRAEMASRLAEALKAKIVMEGRGGKHGKLKEALTWRENDEWAQKLAEEALKSWDAIKGDGE